jgi:hypothetical protein
MRAVNIAKDRSDVVELAWMWLPTFIGQNTGLQKELLAALGKEFPPPWESTNEKMDAIHLFVCNWLETRLRFKGLGLLIDALKYVEVI